MKNPTIRTCWNTTKGIRFSIRTEHCTVYIYCTQSLSLFLLILPDDAWTICSLLVFSFGIYLSVYSIFLLIWNYYMCGYVNVHSISTFWVVVNGHSHEIFFLVSTMYNFCDFIFSFFFSYSITKSWMELFQKHVSTYCDLLSPLLSWRWFMILEEPRDKVLVRQTLTDHILTLVHYGILEEPRDKVLELHTLTDHILTHQKTPFRPDQILCVHPFPS